MKFSKKIFTLISTVLCASLSFTACSTAKSTNFSDSQQKDKKVDMTIMIASPDEKYMDEVVKKVQAHFAGKYNITSKTWSQADAEKNIKTSIASGKPVDLAMYFPNQMETFINAKMALDLTPYLEENAGEWKRTFVDNSLSIGTYDGKTYAVPYTSVYPMIEANKDILDKAGITLPDGSWTWDEFMKDCAIIKEKTGVYPAALNSNWASWTVRNGLLTAWTDKASMENFIAGKVPFTDPTVVKVMDSTKELYDNYLYPGKGAISASLDQINVAFKQGKIAMKFDVNIMASKSIKDSGIKNVKIASWPHMGQLDYVLGGCNGFMIPANAAHPKDSIEIMKYLTSPEIAQIIVNYGTPVTIKGAKSDDPNFQLYSKDSSKVYPKEVMQLSSQVNDYVNQKMPSNYLFSGKESLNEVEALRQQAISSK